MTSPRVECKRCRMGFRLEAPHRRNWSAEYTRCQDCKQRFWHCTGPNPLKVVVGINPTDFGGAHD